VKINDYILDAGSAEGLAEEAIEEGVHIRSKVKMTIARMVQSSFPQRIVQIHNQ